MTEIGIGIIGGCFMGKAHAVGTVFEVSLP